MKLLQLFLISMLFVNAAQAQNRMTGGLLPERPTVRPLPAPIRPSPPAQIGGLQTSLTTTGYQFAQPTAAQPPANVRLAQPVFEGKLDLRATAAITNRGKSPLTLSFADESILERRWNFRLYDSKGSLVWQSEPDAEPTEGATPVTETLRVGRSWNRTVKVPLLVNDAPLPVGRYTLEAVLLADMPIIATSLISIIAPIVKPEPELGTLNVQLLYPDRDETTGNMLPAQGYLISATPIRTLPEPGGKTKTSSVTLTSGIAANPPILIFPEPNSLAITDEQGKASLRLPPGNYLLHARPQVMLTIYPPPPFRTATGKATITANETTETQLILSPLLVIDPPPPLLLGPPVTVTPPSLINPGLTNQN